MGLHWQERYKATVENANTINGLHNPLAVVNQQVRQLTNTNTALNQQITELTNTNTALSQQLAASQAALEATKNILNDPSNYLLLKFAQLGDIEKARAALKLGANIDTTDAEGRSSLFLSLLNDHKDFALFLLENKAKFDIPNNEGQTILHVMCANGNLDMVNFILGKFPKSDPEAKVLLSAYEIASTQEIKQLIANVIFFQAAKQGNVALAQVALAKGAQINAQDEYYLDGTALHKACYANQVEMVQFLLDKGASITKVDQRGTTPAGTTSHKEVQKVILDHQHKHAAIIQANYRGFFTRKKHPLQDLKGQYANEIKVKSAEAMASFAQQGKFDDVIKLANAIKSNQLHQAMQIIRGMPEKEKEYKSGFKVRY